MAKMVGYDARDLIGRPMSEVLRGGDAAAGRLIDRPDAAGQHEVQLAARDGRTIWTLINTRALLGAKGEPAGVLAMVIDISPRKASDEALRQSEERLKTIVDVEPACVKLLSADGKLLDMNRAGLQMIEADDLSQVLGYEVINLVHPADR